jgi:hypothetical protein
VEQHRVNRNSRRRKAEKQKSRKAEKQKSRKAEKQKSSNGELANCKSRATPDEGR